jgi:hypothetical protein
MNSNAATTIDLYLAELPADRKAAIEIVRRVILDNLPNGYEEESRERFEEDYRATSKRLDMGKSCVRFRKLDDLPLALIGKNIAAITVDKFVAGAKMAVSTRKRKKKS